MKNLGIALICLLQFSCSSQVIKKINGVSFVASREEVTQEHIDEVVAIHANHAAIMPFGFMRNTDSPKIIHNTDRQWFGETEKGAAQYVEMLHKNGISVMMKPQIWISRGVFTGTLQMESEENWKLLEASYEDFVMTYVKLAKETQVDIFCIGTELELFVKNRPRFWSELIAKIKKIYNGKLTYAANWDEYTRTPFWSELDYIGIDAYFPLSEEKHPSVAALKEGWQKWKPTIAALSVERGRPVLFTEFGYRSMNFTAKKPWLVDRNDEGVNLEAQVNATQAIFEEFWKEDWFAGGYVWKWFIEHEEVGGANDNRFTPQNKPAEKIIGEWYQKS